MELLRGSCRAGPFRACLGDNGVDFAAKAANIGAHAPRGAGLSQPFSQGVFIEMSWRMKPAPGIAQCHAQIAPKNLRAVGTVLKKASRVLDQPGFARLMGWLGPDRHSKAPDGGPQQHENRRHTADDRLSAGSVDLGR